MPDLRVTGSADLGQIEAKLAAAGTAATRFGDDVDAASRKADAATPRMDSVAESADGVASKGAQAAGALSGLGDLVGGRFGGAMVVGGTAMQAFADAGDLVNVVTESAIVKKTKDLAVTTAHRVATVASTAATKAQAVAQRALNLAMRANPIGLIITAIGLLVAGVILAYKKSETFRAIVHKLGEVGAKAVGWIVEKASALYGWLKDKLGPGVTKAKDIAVGAFKLWLAPIQFVIDKVKAVVGWIGDAIDATKRALGLGKEYGSTMDGIIGDVSRGLKEVADQINETYATGGGGGGSSSGGAGRPGGQRTTTDGPAPRSTTTNVNVEVHGVVGDKAEVGRVVVEALRSYTRTTGVRVVTP